jgi:hypothetical protein
MCAEWRGRSEVQRANDWVFIPDVVLLVGYSLDLTSVFAEQVFDSVVGFAINPRAIPQRTFTHHAMDHVVFVAHFKQHDA